MTMLDFDGLDGTNPLHVLAAFGALLVTHDAVGAARLGWRRHGGRYSPRIEADLDASAWSDLVAERLRRMAATAPVEAGGGEQRRVADLKARVKKLKEALKEAEKRAKDDAKTSGLKAGDAKAFVAERTASRRAELAELEAETQAAETALASSLGTGPAHLGDVIGVPVDVFRAQATKALASDPVTARQLSALASDGCELEGKLTPTPYSFSNGSSGQALLKDFRNLAAIVTGPKVHASLFRGEPAWEAKTSLNWDPSDQRSAAYQWADPGSEDARTDVAANSLAYVGLGLLSCFPGRRGLEATAFDRGFTWPIWVPMLAHEAVRALLAEGFDPSRHDPVVAERRGIVAVYRSDRVNPTGKRNFFAPSRAI